MTQRKPSVWDDLAEIGREIIEKVDELLNPQKKRRELARVPVPVRGNRHLPQDYEDYD